MENLTFSQAYGYEDLPQQLKLEELPPEARTHIWNVFYEFMVNSTRKYEYSYVYMVNEWERILDAKHLFFDNRPMDDWDDSFEHHRNNVRKFIETSRFNRVFDLIQFVFRHVECPREFVYRMQDAFRYSRLAYEIDTGPPPNIVPAVTREEGNAIIDSMASLRCAGLDGSEAHLRKASESINAGDWAASIRESISAVESVARQLDPKESGSLTKALASLEKRQPLHSAFKGALVKLYSYTSDEQGVRHSLLNQSSANVGRDEAVFMLGACASFPSYLWRKHESDR